VSYDILNNLISVDLFYDKKTIEKIFKEKLRILPGRAVDSKKRGSRNVPSLASVRWTTDGKMRELHAH
jgi:hypothetical protein